MIYVSEPLLYACFSLLFGFLILKLVPSDKRPQITLPSWLLPTLSVLIPVLSFVPIHRIVSYYDDLLKKSYGELLRHVLQDMSIGKAWIATLLSSLLFILVIFFGAKIKEKTHNYLLLSIVLIQSVSQGWASHVASLTLVKGVFLHSSHFTAIAIWIGVLTVVAWFSKDHKNWDAFLKWFSPFAMCCVFLSIIAGFMIMKWLAPNYVTSFAFSFGQAILIKHLLILPLLYFAFLNGYQMPRKMKKDPSFNPLPSLKAESIFALLVFIVTGIMGQQAPPHEITLLDEGLERSPLFDALYQGNLTGKGLLSLSFDPISLLLGALALLSLGIGLFAFMKKTSIVMIFILALFASVCGYFAILFAIA